ncbi:hypothetical protein GQ43DRAFT_277952 [Delitschia confertaspora ATCC 74209]|uniref:Uncharacterized protein n=1 Tax=Delitschia confertaspora ATCC 74209 TaxID=1513339 RepID=A0A9P4MQK9_9PLEO|nr:hypothetical protein GQ43DRAFT_277952 [Delitschia confertaspora ATCC 74209]
MCKSLVLRAESIATLAQLSLLRAISRPEERKSDLQALQINHYNQGSTSQEALSKSASRYPPKIWKMAVIMANEFLINPSDAALQLRHWFGITCNDIDAVSRCLAKLFGIPPLRAKGYIQSWWEDVS